MSNDIYPNPETPSKDPLDKKPSPDNKEVLEKIRKRFALSVILLMSLMANRL
ncbi:hypothetical protein IKG20_02160 [Candidatus Saccharibacteria bacterium]|nr:hypothetical protein [Candidatus Saccharibacteria bacterium]